ncbi:site-specific integrase [Protofrankia symbiont of Coriaria ruscifolia]|uniref:site-specific integrase n=1 Tax=Protofrankia symbiont of Coriaria ruscifolia TaxID=1306542 RepID=UPI0010411A90|nr:site-specific integrase [Protofrankia symbiont of Coriaria ruscifolia]
MSGPLAVYADGYATWLSAQGYAVSVVAVHLRLLVQAGRWLSAHGVAVAALDESAAEQIIAWRHAAGRSLRVRAGRFGPLLAFLRSVGAVPPAAASTPSADPVEVLLASYAAYLARERGLAAKTVDRDVRTVRPFLTAQLVDGRLDLSRLTAAEVVAFVRDLALSNPARVVREVGGLRSLLRFLHVNGIVGGDLTVRGRPAARGRAVR